MYFKNNFFYLISYQYRNTNINIILMCISLQFIKEVLYSRTSPTRKQSYTHVQNKQSLAALNDETHIQRETAAVDRTWRAADQHYRPRTSESAPL